MDYSLTKMEKYYPHILMNAISDRFEEEASAVIGNLTWRQFQFLLLVDQYIFYTIDSTEGKINEVKAYPTLNVIANELNTSHQNVKKTVKTLENKGFIQIVADEDDRKKQRIKISESGRDFLIKHNEINKLIDRSLSNISEDDIRVVIEVLDKISKNLVTPEQNLLRVQTCDKKRIIEVDTFKKCKLIPRKKNRPRYQLYGSRGAVLQVSGINRFIVGFYESEADIDKEIDEIDKAIKRGATKYCLKHNCEVEFDTTGMPVIKAKDNADNSMRKNETSTDD